MSFQNSLLGKESEQARHEFLYWEFHEQGGKQAVRWGKWKGIKLNVKSSNSSVFELYDLKIDPSERHNVASSHPDIVKQIRHFMHEAHRESNVFPFIKTD